MNAFSEDKDFENKIGELVLESLLASRIDSIKELDLSANRSWFMHPGTREERQGNIALLAELIIKQAGLQ